MTLVLQCRPGKSENTLTFACSVENQGSEICHVLEALATPGPAPRADIEAACVIAAHGADEAVVGRVMAPLPVDRRVVAPATPLSRAVPAGGSISFTMAVPLPLAEQSCYAQELRLREYDMIEVRAIHFALAYWTAGPRVVTSAVEALPGLSRVAALDLAAAVRVVTQRFGVRPLPLFRRRDAFVRAIPGLAGPGTTEVRPRGCAGRRWSVPTRHPPRRSSSC